MENVKKDQVNSISDILEEIVRCVTAPSFCVMPWKCVTMAVGDRTDPLVKKSVVHIYRTSVNGQNIFQIKVHNCKKEVCDHAICTKDCETTQKMNIKAGNPSKKEELRSETNKRKRKKRNKYPDGRKATTLGCCLVDKNLLDQCQEMSPLKEDNENKQKFNSSSHKSKRNSNRSEYKEKPSCTLQIFADGKSRKLNFQLHPAMKVFLGRALDRIEGRETKVRRTHSPSYKEYDPCEELFRETNDGSKSKYKKKVSKCNPNLKTESVEEFEINLPDNTSLTKGYLDDCCGKASLAEMPNNISKRVSYGDVDQITGTLENKEVGPEVKINAGFLLSNMFPVQLSHNEKGKSCKEPESHLDRIPEKCNNQQLMTNLGHQKKTTEPTSNCCHGRGREKDHCEEWVNGEKKVHSPNCCRFKIQDHQAHNCAYNNNNIGVENEAKQCQTDSVRFISCGNVYNPQAPTNSSNSFQNRTRDNIIRSPYIVDYQNDNNELLVNNIGNINNRNCSIPDNIASMNPTDYLNNPSIYKSNTRIFSPPILPDNFPLSPEYGTFVTNEGACSNRFYGTRQQQNFPYHRSDCINMRFSPTQHQQAPYNLHDTNFPKEQPGRETQISHDKRENRKECNRFNYHQFPDYRDISTYPDPEKLFVRENNKHDHPKNFQDVPTSDRDLNNIINRTKIVTDYPNPSDNNADETRKLNYQRYVRGGGVRVFPEIRNDRKTNKPMKRKKCKESDKSKSNSDNRQSGNSIAPQYLPSCSNIKNKPSIYQNITRIPNIGKHSSDSSGGKENKRFARTTKYNRQEKNNIEEPYLLQNPTPILNNTGPIPHLNYNSINESRTQHENEKANVTERQENFWEFKHLKPSDIFSDEKIMNRLRSNRKFSDPDNSNMSNINDLLLEKIHEESHLFIKRESTETTESSNYLVQDNYTNEASDKSSDILSFCYHFPEDYSSYQFFRANRNENSCREQLSRETTKGGNEGLGYDEYDTDSKFFCYPSQISWGQYENLQHVFPGMPQQNYFRVRNARNKKKYPPKKNVTSEEDSSKLCNGCSKPLNEEKAEGKSFNDPTTNMNQNMSLDEPKDSCGKTYLMNNSQYKYASNLGESYHNNNNIANNQEKPSSNSTNINLTDILSPINHSFPNEAYQNCNGERSDVKSNIVDSSNPIEQNDTVNSGNLQKKQSKMLHSQSVKKFFSHAKEYLNFRKYSSSSIRSGVSNGVPQVGPLNSISESPAQVKKIEEHPNIGGTNLMQVSDVQRNNANKNQCSNNEAKACSENKINVPQSLDIQDRLSKTLKSPDVFRNNLMLTQTYPDEKMSKPEKYTLTQDHLKDETYRLYGSNEIAVDQLSNRNNSKEVKNAFKILESESDCEGFSDDMYCYSSSEWQSEVAKNWVAARRKKNTKHEKKVRDNLKKGISKSVFSIPTHYDNSKLEKEEKKKNYINKPMINATIALSSDQKKGKENKLEIEDHFQADHFSRQKNNYKFTNLFSNSIKNNYKKIKGFVKRTHTQQKNKSPSRVPISISDSYTESQSQSFSTPLSSTYISSKSGVNAIDIENSTTVEQLCGHSSTNNYTSDSNYAKSDPIIRKIVPGTWQKIVSKKQSTEVSDGENNETENSSMSDTSFEESTLPLRSNKKLTRPFSRTDGVKHTQIRSQSNFTQSGTSEERRGFNTYETNHPDTSESMDEYNQSDESELSNCFEDPMVDPKTGFRPLQPTST